MLNKALIEDTLNAALSTGGDFAEIFVEDRTNSIIEMIGGKIESTTSGRDYGVGVRIYKGFNSVYAYTNKSDRDSLISVAKKAAQAMLGAKNDITLNLTKTDIINNHKILISPQEVAKTRKIDAMRRVYDAAKNYDSLISQVSVRHLDHDQHIMIANSEGLWKEDRRVRNRLFVSSVASKDGEMQSGSQGPGAMRGFEFIESLDLEQVGREASRIAKTMVNARYCPSGKFPVIIDNGFGGVIFHEACGHGLEATSVAKGTSIFCDKVGQKIASSLVTAVDDGTLANEWGSINIDDEGNPSQKNILIENGILKGYMIDRLNGRRMGMASTGSGRKQSYKYAPTSRMTNTYIAAGSSKVEEIFANTEYGIYARYMGGGSVNPSTGDFNFAVMEGYIVENGKITVPVRGATLIGKGIDVLTKIDMVSDNMTFGQGMCGSSSGSVPTNVGQPLLRVAEITVGGRE